MLSQMKWVRTTVAALMVVALLSGAAWAKGKPPKDPPPDPDPTTPNVTFTVEAITPFSFQADDSSQRTVKDLNNEGVFVGSTSVSSEYRAHHGYVYDSLLGLATDLHDLLAPDGWELQQATGINDLGWITGRLREDITEEAAGFIYKPGEPPYFVMIHAPSGYNGLVPSDINESGDIAGTVYTEGAPIGGGLEGGTPFFCPFPGDGTPEIDVFMPSTTSAVTGLAGSPGNPLVQVLVEEGGVRYIPGFGLLLDGVLDIAEDINESGQIAGAVLGKRYYQPYRYTDGEMLALGFPKSREHSYASSINMYGDVVGTSGPEDAIWAAPFYQRLGTFLYVDGYDTIDIDDLLADSPESLLWLEAAEMAKSGMEINDQGRIVVVNYIRAEGRFQILMLVPDNPPSEW